MRERFDVKSASADNDRDFSAGMDFADRAERKFPELFRVHLFQDRHRADQMMRNLCQRCRVWFRG